MRPDLGAALPPTPHPLAELFGLVASPLGDGAVDLTMVIAYASLGLVGYLVYRLGSLWFDRPIGAVAALIVLTRAPFLSNGLRAYVDLPYIALVPRRAGDRDEAPPRRLAGPRPPRPRRPPPPRGLALLHRLLRLPALQLRELGAQLRPTTWRPRAIA